MEKNKFMLVIILAVLVLMLGTIIGVSLYVLNIMQNQALEAEDTGNRNPQAIRKLAVEEKTPIELGEPLQTNLKTDDDGKSRYIQMLVTVEVDNTQGKESEAVITLINRYLYVARSITFNLVRNRTYADVQDNPDGVSLLEREILEALRDEFESNLIVGVVISDYIMQ
ncbi:MAG: flagellar basal body-associated FliL family protein [Defluviitaleaceae bacterium]|nr:flagellar basal body-associated FliL family protein [Defluviitaleaceae bacterium]